MAINQFIINLVKSLKAKKTNINLNYAKSKNYLFYLISAITLFIIFLVTNNLMVERNKAENQNFSSVIKSKEFQILGDYFISKINSPYKEIEYLIQNNDSVEKILKKFDINKADMKNISIELKEKKLTNIYAGRKLSMVLKKTQDGLNSIVSLVYPTSNISYIEIRKSKNQFLEHKTPILLRKQLN